MKTDYKYQKKSFFIITVFVCLVVLGINLLPRLNVQLNPSLSLPKLTIRYSWSDASARVIEKEVTTPLEGFFSAVKGVESIDSKTWRGGGNIQVSLKKNVNIDAARFEISNLVRQSYSKLPEGVSYPVISMGTRKENEKPLLTYTLSAHASPFYIKKFVDEKLVKEFNSVLGVGEVKVYGDTPYHYQITYDTDVLALLGMNVQEVGTAIRDYFKRQYVGKTKWLDKGDNKVEISVSLGQRTDDSFSIESIPIKTVNQHIVYLSDVAKLQYLESDPNSFFRINGLNTLNIVIYPENGTNNLKLAKELRELGEGIKKNLPVNYELILAYDESEYIQEELDTIIWRSIFSVFVLFLFVLILTRQIKYLLIIVLSIVVNLIIAILFYYLLNLEIHLYVMAGITISLGIIIDNSIVMIDHMRAKRDKKVLLAILAATLTTIAALSVVFLLKPEQRVNLLDFAIVITVNLSVSIFVALYFIPALMEKVGLGNSVSKRTVLRKRRVIYFTMIYRKYINFSRQFRPVFILILFLSFGLPIYFFPEKIEGEGLDSKLYNNTIGSDWYQKDAKPILEKVLGGSLRLFTEYVFETSYYSEPERTSLQVTGKMPEGCTLEQMNQAIIKMEHFVSDFDEVEIFETSITSSQNARMRIYFKPDYEWTGFPYVLKSQLESKAISLGGLDWGVFGVGRGFSNALHTGYKNSRIQLEGYNYNKLYEFAEELRRNLLTNARIKEVDITGPQNRDNTNKSEYTLDFNADEMASLSVNKKGFYEFIKDRASSSSLTTAFIEGELQEVVLRPDVYKVFDVWNLNYAPIVVDSKGYKFNQLGSLAKRQTGNDIHKRNQQYQLMVAYDFIGPDLLGKKVREQYVEELKTILPIGFRVFSKKWRGWSKDDKNQYYLIIYIVLCIFIICSILFESIRQPFAIVLLVPVSFIGTFLTFYIFDINFDQGGLAAFVMVAGLVVNSGIYIINDYNNIRLRHPKLNPMEGYLKSYNLKCIPIFLTILSTALGLVPFLWDGQHDVFWYAFAAGTTGGLIFSLIAIVFCLPLLVRFKR